MAGNEWWNTTQSASERYRDMYPSWARNINHYRDNPAYTGAWQQVRKDSQEAVRGVTEGIFASPYRMPNHAMANEPWRHSGEIGDPGDAGNKLDQPWEIMATMDYMNRTGWYSDEARAKRTGALQAAEFEARIKKAEEEARERARLQYEKEQSALKPVPLEVQQTSPKPVPGIEAAQHTPQPIPPPWYGQQAPTWYGQQAPEWWGQRQPAPPWTAGTQYYNPQGVRSGRMDYIRNRRGPSFYFGRDGRRLELDNLNI